MSVPARFIQPGIDPFGAPAKTISRGLGETMVPTT